MKKRIRILDEKDYKRFLKRILFYKSIFYWNTIFEVENEVDNINIESIISALNIKRRRKRIEYVYDTACLMIDQKVGDCNICGFQKNQCYIQRKKKNGQCNGCCRMCLYQTKNGCPSKNLACKLFYCSEVKSRYDVLKWEDIPLLKLLSLKNQYVVQNDYFSMREDVLKDLYCYTFTFSCLRIFYRLFKNKILFSKRD